jgi:hypothetical protein
LKYSDFGEFLSPEMAKKIRIFFWARFLGVQRVDINIEGWFQNLYFLGIWFCSQIWLNLPEDDRHFYYIKKTPKNTFYFFNLNFFFFHFLIFEKLRIFSEK